MLFFQKSHHLSAFLDQKYPVFVKGISGGLIAQLDWLGFGECPGWWQERSSLAPSRRNMKYQDIYLFKTPPLWCFITCKLSCVFSPYPEDNIITILLRHRVVKHGIVSPQATTWRTVKKLLLLMIMLLLPKLLRLLMADKLRQWMWLNLLWCRWCWCVRRRGWTVWRHPTSGTRC